MWSKGRTTNAGSAIALPEFNDADILQATAYGFYTVLKMENIPTNKYQLGIYQFNNVGTGAYGLIGVGTGTSVTPLIFYKTYSKVIL